VIRFSAFLVAVAVGLLVAGVVTSKLFLVYLAIAVSAVALLSLGIGAVVKWRELFATPKTVASDVDLPKPAPASQDYPIPAVAAAMPAAAATRATGLAHAGLSGSGGHIGSPASQQADVQRPPAAFMPRPSAGSGAPAPGVWEWRDDSPASSPAVSPDRSGVKDKRPAREPQPDPTATSFDLPVIVVPDSPALDPTATSFDLPAVVVPEAQDHPAPKRSTPEALLPEAPAPQAPAPKPPAPEAFSPEAPAPQASSPEASAPEPSTSEALIPEPSSSEAPAPEPSRPESLTPEASSPEAPTPEASNPEAPSPEALSPETPSTEASISEAPSPVVSTPEASSSEPLAAEPAEHVDPSPPDSASPESSGPDPQTEVTVVPGVPRYHNATCILIRFMGQDDLEKMTIAQARENGCTPCRACLPDQPDHQPE
jgi:hypothetical protein